MIDMEVHEIHFMSNPYSPRENLRETLTLAWAEKADYIVLSALCEAGGSLNQTGGTTYTCNASSSSRLKLLPVEIIEMIIETLRGHRLTTET